MKPTKLITSAPWMIKAARRCPGTHEHAPHLCNKSARDSAAYVPAFCKSAAAAYAKEAP